MRSDNKIIVYLVLFLIINLLAIQVKAEIIIIEPQDDGSVFSDKLPVTVFVNDTGVKSVSVRLVGYSWQVSEQVTGKEFSSIIDLAGIPDGTYQLSAKYVRFGETIPVYIGNTTAVMVKKNLGTFEVTFRESGGVVVSGVSMSGNVSGTDGKVRVSGLVMAKEYNFTYSKSGYRSGNIVFVPSKPEEFLDRVIEKNISEGELDVKGYEGLEFGRGVFVLVTDSVTGSKIDGASIVLYEGQVVKSIPGETQNGRLFVSLDSDAVPGAYMISVTKKGYKDWSDDFYIRAKPTPVPTVVITPAPTVVLTPVPTVESKYRPDANQRLTDDEYRQYLSVQEIKKAEANRSVAPPVSFTPEPPRQNNGFSGMLLLIPLLLAGGVVYAWKKREGKKSAIPEDLVGLDMAKIRGDDEDIVRCDKCSWSISVPRTVSKDVRDAVLRSHEQEYKHDIVMENRVDKQDRQ